MGIPRKDTKANSHYLVQALKAFGEGLMSIPRALKEVPNLPKPKLFKLTGFFFGGSLAVRYMKYVSMVSKNWWFDSYHCFCRHYSYGLDYREVIDSSKSSCPETEESD